jgi:SAM-dependent methyltransferase
VSGKALPAGVARFAFPLNVYARMLELEDGRVDHLHYGLFDRPDEPVAQAQERATRLLWSVLPPPCRVLEVGIGVGTTLRRLAMAGYQALGITPDAAQLAEVRARLGDGVALAQTLLEDLAAPDQPWELMLLQESAQYIEPLSLFEAADRLLRASSATLVVMDEFALRRRGGGDLGLHDLDAFVALARRMGWRLSVEHDVSAAASGTLVVIGRLVQRHRQALLRDLDVTAEQLDQLLDSSRRYQDLYDQGVFGYRLLRLDRTVRPLLRLGAVAQAESPAMRRLFEQVFGQPLTPADWHWKYGDGRGSAVGLWQGDRLLAHYGGITRTIRMDGADVPACQVGDVMVLPEANAGLARQGAFQQVAATALARSIGWGRRHLLGYGFPNARALRVAQRLGLYEPVDQVLQLEWPAPPAGRWADRLLATEPVRADALQPGQPVWRALQELWSAMHTALPHALLPVRDPAWIRHRYGRRPGVAYQVYLLRRRLGGQAVGAFVLRLHADHAELMDLIGAARHMPSLVRAARARAGAQGVAWLRLWITASQAHWVDDPADPAARIDIDVFVPTCIHTPGPAPDSLRGRWFLTGGDTDFR